MQRDSGIRVVYASLAARAARTGFVWSGIEGTVRHPSTRLARYKRCPGLPLPASSRTPSGYSTPVAVPQVTDTRLGGPLGALAVREIRLCTSARQ